MNSAPVLSPEKLSPEKSAYVLTGALALVVAASFALRHFDWGDGPVRGLLLFEMLVAMIWLGRSAQAAIIGPRLQILVNVALAIGLALWLASAAWTITGVARTGTIPLDQGQTTWRAARLLLRGENPYGAGALVDFQAFFDRLPQRDAAGVGPQTADVHAALAAYDRDLGAAQRAKLLPPGPAEGAAGLEAHLLGYKYGPLFPLLAAPLVAAGLPAGIMALNGLAAALTLAALYALMRERLGDPRLARLGLAALLLDNTILVNFIEKSATDIWALLFMALAALAVTRGRWNLGAAALAVGFGFKIFPSALAFPMLLAGGRLRSAATFAAVAGAIYLPFALADPQGLLHNVFLWPAYLGLDTTSWLAFAPPVIGKFAHGASLLGVALVWGRYLSGREPSLFRTLALAALLALLGSAAFHNNYAPWASIWIVAALTERFGPPLPARAAAAAGARLAPA